LQINGLVGKEMEARKRTQRTAIPDGASTDDVAADEPAQKHPPASPSNNRRKRGKKAINCSVSSLFLFVILGWCTTALVLLKVSSTPNGETSSLSTSTSSRSYSYNQREFPLIRTLFQTLPEGGIKFPSHEDRFRVPETFLPAKPRVVGYYFATATTDKGSFLGSEPLDPNLIKLYRSRNAVLEYVSSRDIDAQKALKNSKDYWHGAQDPMSEEEECEAQYDWQLHSFPTCNLLHEIDMTYMSNQKGDERNRLIAHGYWRDVWLPSAFGKMVLKTIRWAHDFTERNFDRHRRDAVAMERLSSSPNVMDIYGYCGNSGMFEFADGGDIEDSLWNDKGLKWSSQENLMVAYQVVSGLADVHEYGAHDIAAIAHADITTSQFVYVREEQTFKLNDFNRCRFMAWNPKTKKQCGFYVGNNPGLVSEKWHKYIHTSIVVHRVAFSVLTCQLFFFRYIVW
jgi:hypothetical protein